jgi:hypothetical protein
MLFLAASTLYSGLTIVVLVVHVLFLLWVIFGAFLTRTRPVLQWLHIGSLVWGMLTGVFYYVCPLTLLENWLEQRAGIEPYQGGFVLHYLDKLVYPDLPNWALTSAAMVVCTLNFTYYARQFWIGHRRKTTFEVVRDEQR